MIYKSPPRYLDAHLEKNNFIQGFEPAINYLKSFSVKSEKNYRGDWILKLSDDSPKNNLILSGGVGVGKTWLIHAFLKYFTEKFGDKALYYKDRDGVIKYNALPIPIEYKKIKEIVDDIRYDWKEKRDGQTINYLSQVPLLIIDEIGVNYGTESERIELYELFNARWENMLPTIIISNLVPKDKDGKPDMVSMLGQRIMDRICDDAIILKIESDTRRKHTENWQNK